MLQPFLMGRAVALHPLAPVLALEIVLGWLAWGTDLARWRAEALPRMLAKGRERGIEFRGPSDHGMIDSIYFRDPNGYVIELCAKRADHDLQMNPATNGARAALERWKAGKTTLEKA